MRIREIVIYLYMVVMVLGLASTTITFRESQELLLVGFYFLIGVCGVILANWVHVDGKKIEELSEKVKELEQRIQRQ
jgi:hypothetical protein